MARKRMLDPSIWDDEHVGMLSPNAFRLFICCISNADDDGKLLGSARYLRALAFRFSDDVSVEATAGWLDEIASKMRSFQRYTVAGREYIRFLKWHEYQVINKPTASKLPDPDGPATPAETDDYGSTTVALRDDSHLIEEKGSKEKGSKEKRREVRTSESEDESDPFDSDTPPDTSPVQSVFGYYKERIQPQAKLCPTDKIKARLKRFSEDELRTAIDHFAADAWWMEHNGTRGGGWFFHSDQRIEQFLLMTPRKEAAKRNGSHSDYGAGAPISDELRDYIRANIDT